MAFKRTLFLIVTLFVCLSQSYSDEEFVNPSDLLNFDPVNIRMNNKVEEKVAKETSLEKEDKTTPSDVLQKTQLQRTEEYDESLLKDKQRVDVEKQCPKVKDEALKSFFKRYLMSLVLHIESRIESPKDPVEFCMKMKASYSDMMLLKLYGTGSTDDVHDVHEKLDKMFLYTTELPDERPYYWLEKKIGLSTPVLLLVIAVLLLGIIAARMLSRVRITKSFITKGILIAFFISCVFTYIELYQQKVADQDKILSEAITERCPHLSQSTFDRFTGYFFSSFTFQDENCREYYEAVVVNPLFKVNVLEAGAIAITKTMVAPLKILGNGLKQFIVGFFKDLPAQFSSVMMVVMLVILIILPFLMSGYSLRIPFILTLQAPQTTQYLPPPETKPVQCMNCIRGQDQVREVEDSRSTYLTASPPLARPSIMSTQGPQIRQVSNSCPKNYISSTSIRGESGDHERIIGTVSEYDNTRVQEIVVNLKNINISQVSPSGAESLQKANGERDEKAVKAEEKICYTSHDELEPAGLSRNVGQRNPTVKGLASTVEVEGISPNVEAIIPPIERLSLSQTVGGLNPDSQGLVPPVEGLPLPQSVGGLNPGGQGLVKRVEGLPLPQNVRGLVLNTGSQGLVPPVEVLSLSETVGGLNTGSQELSPPIEGLSLSPSGQHLPTSVSACSETLEDANVLSNSNFFVDEEVRIGDAISEAGVNCAFTQPSESENVTCTGDIGNSVHRT